MENIIPQLYSTIIGLIPYIFEENKDLGILVVLYIVFAFVFFSYQSKKTEKSFLTKLCIFISILLILGFMIVFTLISSRNQPNIEEKSNTNIYSLNFMDIDHVNNLINKDIASYLENSDLWKLIQINFVLEDYEKMLEIAETNQVMKTEKMLNILGVMYAQGIHFKKNYEEALKYIDLACLYGNEEQSYINLWLISYLADRERDYRGLNIYRNSKKALEIAEKNNNESLNQMLITGIKDCFGKTVVNGYDYIKSLPREKEKILLDSFGYDMDGYKVVKCTEFHYAVFINDETSTLDAKYDIKVIPYKLEERENYIFMFTNSCPGNYVLFDDLYLSPSLERYRVIELFEYEPTYEDDNGNTYYWMDTDEVYYGNIPPNTDEKSRWMLTGYNKDHTERKFKLQRKQ